MNQGFPKRYRIVKTDDFSSVFNLRKRIQGHYLVVHYRVLSRPEFRLGVTVSKKISQLSVERNFIKRTLREVFRTNRTAWLAIMPHDVGLDLVVRVQRHFTKQEVKEVRVEFLNLLVRLFRQFK